jgi:hypothetical protein
MQVARFEYESVRPFAVCMGTYSNKSSSCSSSSNLVHMGLTSNAAPASAISAALSSLAVETVRSFTHYLMLRSM